MKVSVVLGDWRVSMVLNDADQDRWWWEWDVVGPGGEGATGRRSNKRHAWEEALAQVPQPVLVEHWSDLPYVA